MKRILDNELFKRTINFFIKYKKVFLIVLGIILIIIGIVINNKDKLIVKKEIEEIDDIKQEYVIDISGEVKQPGIYSIYNEMYLFEFIDMCGGFTQYANIDDINLLSVINSSLSISVSNSGIINDNKINVIDYSNSDFNYVFLGRVNGKINIYKVNNNITFQELFWMTNINNTFSINISDVISSNVYITHSEGKICINTATIEELTNLNNIGESTANKIIEYRNTYGLFKSIEEIMNVSGIGENTYNLIKDYICIN